MGGEYTPPGPLSRVTGRIHLDLRLEGELMQAAGALRGSSVKRFCRRFGRIAGHVAGSEIDGWLASSARCAVRRPDRGSSRSRRRQASAPAAISSRACRRVLHAAHADDRDRDARRRRPRPGRARSCRIAGPDSPPVRPPSQGRRSPGATAIARIVLISETASRAALLGGRGARRHVGGVGRQLDDQRLRVSGRTARRTLSSSRGSAPMSSRSRRSGTRR